METIASRIYKPTDFSEGLWHEVLVTLGKKGFSPKMAAEVVNTKSGKAGEIVDLFSPVALDPTIFFQKFYRDFCGLEVDFSKAKVPELQRDFARTLGIPRGLTLSRMFEALKQHFPCWRYTEDLDGATKDLNERESTESYFIRVRDRQEADEELKNLSANNIKERNLKTETLLERLVHEGVWYFETGDHLDKDNVTNCTGSRYHVGPVPSAFWRRGRFEVSWCDPAYSYVSLRSRQAVS